MTPYTPPGAGVSTLLPPDLRNALVDAATWPKADRQARIDHLTDEAARRGLVRDRHDSSTEPHWRGAWGPAS